MKTYFSFVLCLLASLLVTACDNDKEEENNKVVIDGETYTEVNISLSQSDETPFNDDVLPESYPLDFYLMNVESEAIRPKCFSGMIRSCAACWYPRRLRWPTGIICC